MPVLYSPLSDNELDSICLSLVNQDLPYFSAFHEAFVLLYLTGCRVEEIFDINRWERLQSYEMMFLPQKDNYWRYVTLDSRCDSFIDAVVGRYKPFGGLSSGQLNSLFYNFSQYSNYKVGTKPVSLYLFRYNFIRRLFNDGLNINQIADKMGYTSTTVVGGYLTAEIEKGFFLDTDGFININGTWWSQNYLSAIPSTGYSALFSPFLNSTTLRYYSKAAVLSYLSENVQFRLPSDADFLALNSYLFAQFGYLSSCLELPDLNYFNVVLPSMINLFGMALLGTGYAVAGGVYSNMVQSYLMVSHTSTNMMGYYLPKAPSKFYPSEFNKNVILPVRLILVL